MDFSEAGVKVGDLLQVEGGQYLRVLTVKPGGGIDTMKPISKKEGDEERFLLALGAHCGRIEAHAMEERQHAHAVIKAACLGPEFTVCRPAFFQQIRP